MTRPILSLKFKLILCAGSGVLVTCIFSVWLEHRFHQPLLSVLIGSLSGLFFKGLLVIWGLRSLDRIFGALHLGIMNLKDSDFNVQMPEKCPKDRRQISHLFNELTQTMRKERRAIFQRELILETILQQSPSATLLVNEKNKVVFSNIQIPRLYNGSFLMKTARFLRIELSSGLSESGTQ